MPRAHLEVNRETLFFAEFTQVTKPIRCLRIPLDFATSPEFLALRVMTKDEPPVLLGRLIALALTMQQQHCAKFRLTEVDAICSWRGTTPFAHLLEKVGWTVPGPMGEWQVEVRMPSMLQPPNRQRDAVKAWADSAKRDARGRLLPRGSL